MTDSAANAPSLDAVLAALSLAPHEVQAFDPAHPRIDAQRPLLVLAAQFEAALAVLADRYPAGHRVSVLARGAVESATTGELASRVAPADAWLVDPLPPEDDLRSLAGLRAIIERLYAPGGCPWDGEQTHETLRGYLIEETYEAVEAIDRGDIAGLREELGDVLMQIFFHAAIAQAHEEFTLEDVVETIARKMVRRHPHVFGDVDAGADSNELWARWDAIKAEERAAAGKDGADDSPFASLPLSLPALQRAQSLQGRAERASLAGTATASDALPAVSAALEALDAAPAAERSEHLGALLWAVAAFARMHDLDAESALRETSVRFTDRVAPGSAPPAD